MERGGGQGWEEALDGRRQRERSGRRAWLLGIRSLERGGAMRLYDDEVVGAEGGYEPDPAIMRELLNDGWY